jgi:dipeptidyl aminopeptidase/acylaminoacyl peptidase
MPAPTAAWVDLSAAVSPLFSRDGATLFHLRGAGQPQVWAMDLNGGDARQISFHDENVAFLARAPKDDRLVWGIDAGGDERQQIWTLAPGGVPSPLTDAPSVIHDQGAISPDGALLSVTANDRDETVFDLKVLDLATGAQRLVFAGDGILKAMGWSPDGAKIALLDDFSNGDQRLLIVEASTGAVSEIPHDGATRYLAARWAQGRLHAITDAGGCDFLRLCRIDPQSGAVEVAYEAPGRDVEAWAFAADSGLLATVENDRGYARLRIGPIEGERPFVEGLPEGVIGDLSWSADGANLAFSVQGPTDPAGIYLWRAGAARPVWIPEPVAGLPAFVAPRLVEWVSADGLAIPGFFAIPAGPAPAAGRPAIIWVHGGPSAQTRANFRPDIQMLIDQGFAVLLPNIRGSTGYGRAYMEADEVALRPACLDDLAAAHAWLQRQPGIDPARIGVMGQSYGGWVVLAAIALQPTLWKAAVNFYGIADFVTLLDRTGPWRRDHRAREYGFPGTDDALFDQISPIRHVQNVAAPLLVLHGDRDPRVPMYESDSFVEAMRQRQKQVRYEEFDYAGHGFIRPDHRRRVYAAVVEHFQAWL